MYKLFLINHKLIISFERDKNNIFHDKTNRHIILIKHCQKVCIYYKVILIKFWEIREKIAISMSLNFILNI